MKVISQIIVVGFLSLTLGLMWNQVNPKGIPLRLLWAQMPWSGNNQNSMIGINDAFSLSLRAPVKFLDLRSESEYNIDHIPGSISLAWLNAIRNPAGLDTLSSNQTYILYTFHSDDAPCKTVATLMKKRGLKEIYILQEGFAEWLDLGLPVELGVDG